MLRNLPVAHPGPDAERFIAVLMGRAPIAHPPLVEYLIDDAVMKPIVEELIGRRWVDENEDRESQRAYLDNFIEFWRRMGYDFVRFERSLDFPKTALLAPDTAPGVAKQRSWADEHGGVIRTWEDFERYPWPAIEEMDFFPYEYINSHLPEGMGLVASHAGGIFEHLSWLMSMEGLCLSLHDNTALVKAVSDRLGDLMTSFYETLLELDRLIAVFPGDDMGFRTATIVAPSMLREYVLPWHRRFARMAHQRGLPYFLHSCGDVTAIMDDLISDVEIDGKHSFEDAIMPVDDFQARYGAQIAVLGGLDINILAGASPDIVSQHTRFLMETCGSRGRYAIGSANSIPSYVSVENYLAMVDEALDGGMP